MNKFVIPALALLFSVACDDKGGATGSTGTTTPGGAVISSCDWGIGLCYEYEDYDASQAWCDDMAAQYGFDTVHAAGPCPTGETARCALGAGGDLDVAGTAYYYDDFSGDPATACSDAGGTLL